MKLRKYILFALFGVLLLVGGIAWYGGANSPAASTMQNVGKERQLTIYSGRKEPLILPIIQSFEEKTGIKTTVKAGSSQELANLLLEEKDRTQADVYLSTDASLLEKIAREELFIPITADLSSIPSEYKSKNNLWTGVSGRARVLIINTDLVSQSEKPDSIYDIIDPQWKGKVAMASINNESVVTHISAIRELRGDQFTSNFLDGLRNNEVEQLKGHTEVRQAVAKGEFAVGFVNHYYGHLQQLESDNIEIIYPDQKTGEDGAFTNISGMGIIKNSDNISEAQEFVAYLLSEEAQKKFAELNFEFPLKAGIQSSNTKNIGEFKKMNVDLYTVSQRLDETIRFIKEKGL